MPTAAAAGMAAAVESPCGVRRRSVSMSDRIVPADPHLRRWSLLAVCLVAVVGGLLLFAVRNALREMHDRFEAGDPVDLDRIVLLVRVLAVSSALGLVGCALWFWRLGTRVLRGGEYPPPGMKVIKETRVKSGGAARRLAHAALLASVVLMALGTMGVWGLYHLALRALW